MTAPLTDPNYRTLIEEIRARLNAIESMISGPKTYVRPKTSSSWERIMLLITEHIANDCGLPTDEIFSRLRTQRVSDCRQLSMWMIRTISRENKFEMIGYFFKRDHGTAIHAMKAVDAKRSTDPDYLARTDALLAEINELMPKSEQHLKNSSLHQVGSQPN